MPQMSPLSWVTVFLLLMLYALLMMPTFKELKTESKFKTNYTSKKKTLLW